MDEEELKETLKAEEAEEQEEQEEKEQGACGREFLTIYLLALNTDGCAAGLPQAITLPYDKLPQ